MSIITLFCPLPDLKVADWIDESWQPKQQLKVGKEKRKELSSIDIEKRINERYPWNESEKSPN